MSSSNVIESDWNQHPIETLSEIRRGAVSLRSPEKELYCYITGVIFFKGHTWPSRGHFEEADVFPPQSHTFHLISRTLPLCGDNPLWIQWAGLEPKYRHVSAREATDRAFQDALSQAIGEETIEVDPSRRGGVPVLRGTRFPVARVFAEVADDRTLSELADDYDLELESLRKLFEALAFHADTPSSR